MAKLRFEFVVKASKEDLKTNIICITSITDEDKNVFLIPEQYQPVKLHDKILQTQAYLTVKNTLQRRHDKRKVWISMTTELLDTYMDPEGNMKFKGFLLEESTPEVKEQAQTAGISDEALSKLLQNLSDLKGGQVKTHKIRNLKDQFVMEKFTRKTSSASQWITMFEAECTRLDVEENSQRIELFRLFLDETCLDWYSAMLIKHTINSEWSLWRKTFCETYADKGWSPIRYALLFKYRQGSLLDYALKKERLLLEINKNMDKPTIIDLIATGLPNFIADKIDRDTLKRTEDLFSNIRSLEYLVERKNWEKKGVGLETKLKDKNVKEYQPCKICEKEGKYKRYHPESLCWFKNKTPDRLKRDQIKSVNNFELETELNEVDPKN